MAGCTCGGRLGGSEAPCFAACLPGIAAAAVQPQTRSLQAEAQNCSVSVKAMLVGVGRGWCRGDFVSEPSAAFVSFVHV